MVINSSIKKLSDLKLGLFSGAQITRPFLNDFSTAVERSLSSSARTFIPSEPFHDELVAVVNRTNVSCENVATCLAGVNGFAGEHGKDFITPNASNGSLQKIIKKLKELPVKVAIIHHPQDSAAVEIASATGLTVINAGSGSSENPARALADAFHLRQALGERLDAYPGIQVAIIGNPHYPRAAKSLAFVLANCYPNSVITFVSTDRGGSQLTDGDQQMLIESDGTFYELPWDGEPGALRQFDVIYQSPAIRLTLAESDNCGGIIHITPEILRHMGKQIIVLHAGPFGDELDPEVDKDGRAGYKSVQAILPKVWETLLRGALL